MPAAPAGSCGARPSLPTPRGGAGGALTLLPARGTDPRVLAHLSKAPRPGSSRAGPQTQTCPPPRPRLFLRLMSALPEVCSVQRQGRKSHTHTATQLLVRGGTSQHSPPPLKIPCAHEEIKALRSPAGKKPVDLNPADYCPGFSGSWDSLCIESPNERPLRNTNLGASKSQSELLQPRWLPGNCGREATIHPYSDSLGSSLRLGPPLPHIHLT